MPFGTQRRFAKVLAIGDRKERENALRKLAKHLGCSLQATNSVSENGGIIYNEVEVVRRIREAGRESRDAALWWVALISALASVVSAISAWVAVTKTL